MNVLKTLLPSLGIFAMLVCLPASAQHKSSPSSAQLTGKSSSLGGPITPTQPDFFANSDSLSVFNSENDGQPKTISAGPLVQPVDRKPAPMVDDPPRPAGGFFTVKTE
jgi:hypothetical protein